jgi:hypothetical protein
LTASVDPELRAAWRAVVTLIGALALVVLAAGLLVMADRRQDDRVAADQHSEIEAGAVPVQSVGPRSGTRIRLYQAERAEAIRSASGTRLAVVSLTRYASEAEARGATGDVDVVGLLVAPSGGEPQFVDEELRLWSEQERAAAARERGEIERLLPTVPEGDFAAFYRTEVVRLRRVERELSTDTPLVFGLVLRAPAEVLRSLARAPGVRLVDVAPHAQAAPGATFRGIRPEEIDVAGDPATRP